MSRTYSYGHVLTSEVRLIGANWTPSFYGLDGHGSVRFLTNLSGNVTDAYDYDAFGMSIHLLGPTPNAYLFSGEQFDADLGFYYLRARYLNAVTGRFWRWCRARGSSTVQAAKAPSPTIPDLLRPS